MKSPAESARAKSPVLETAAKSHHESGGPTARRDLEQATGVGQHAADVLSLKTLCRATHSAVRSHSSLPAPCTMAARAPTGCRSSASFLGNIDSESIDYDTLLYCYLKIASRLWHRPFGLLIDATCYTGQSEPQDELFQRLEMLTPTELSRQLSRIYIYNMNSACKKCFRRILRLSAKNESSVFNPKNVGYHLIGSIQELQTHFHLSQLHLPRRPSASSPTRYVFQPITRLSRSRAITKSSSRSAASLSR